MNITHCGLVRQYRAIDQDQQIGSDNGLLPDGINTLPEPIYLTVIVFCGIHLRNFIIYAPHLNSLHVFPELAFNAITTSPRSN